MLFRSNIYNNTFYQDKDPSQVRPLVQIYTNTDENPAITVTGTKIKNNIFYTRYKSISVSVGSDCLSGFECDYNVYYCEEGDHTPVFNIDGETLTWAQWQSRGYDLHSKVINPGFKDLTYFVPASRLDNGVSLGADWQYGLSISARWGSTSPATTVQNGTWQAGAVVYAAVVTPPVTPPPVTVPLFVNASVENATPARIDMNYNMTLASVVPAASSFTVRVNSTTRTVSTVTVSGSRVMLALGTPLAYGDAVTVAYTKPSVNPLQTTSGGQAATLTAQNVVNRVNAVVTPPVTPPATVNTPPVIVVNYKASIYSGFTGEINASGSYDANKEDRKSVV